VRCSSSLKFRAKKVTSVPEQLSNVELAHKINEQGHHHGPRADRRFTWVEIAEAFVLAIVAVATAWSGYQATKWDALSNEYYSLASRTNVRAQEKATLAGQDHLYDVVTFNGWIAAQIAGNNKLAETYERRFRSEYKAAFLAWQKLDPFKNPSAPPGPIFMSEYASANTQDSKKLAEESNGYFEKGVNTRETGDHYVKVSVFLATVLLLTALGQRFERFWPRTVLLVVAFILLLFSTYSMFTFPRA
jgi:hypothetical protein